MQKSLYRILLVAKKSQDMLQEAVATSNLLNALDVQQHPITSAYDTMANSWELLDGAQPAHLLLAVILTAQRHVEALGIRLH